jgi:hypothetical protein
VTMISKQLLKIAGGLSFAVAIFQAVISFSPSWSLYFGAPEKLVSNLPMLYVAGLIAAVIFGVFGLFGLYALAGARTIRPLPLLRLGLAVIGGVYTLRGLLVIPVLLIRGGILQSSAVIPPQASAASLISLFIGVLYLAGTMLGWRELPSRTKG